MNRVVTNRLVAFALLFFGFGVLNVQAEEQIEIAQKDPVALINTPKGLAVRGYDPVAYFTDGKPVAGSDRYEYEWQGARWRFASAEHLDAFKAEPERYAPQFGGYCALAVSLGRIADGDPKRWAVVDGKLYLNNNALALAFWNRDRPGNIALGDKKWPLIPKFLPKLSDAPVSDGPDAH